MNYMLTTTIYSNRTCRPFTKQRLDSRTSCDSSHLLNYLSARINEEENIRRLFMKNAGYISYMMGTAYITLAVISLIFELPTKMINMVSIGAVLFSVSEVLEIQDDQKAKVDLVKTLAATLQTRFDNEPQSLPTKAYIYGSQGFASHISLVIDITRNDGTIFALEPYFIKAGNDLADYQHIGYFNVTIWVRNSAQREVGLDVLEQVLNRNRIPYEPRMSKAWGKCLEIKQFDYSKDINDKEVENFLFDLWKVIATNC